MYPPVLEPPVRGPSPNNIRRPFSAALACVHHVDGCCEQFLLQTAVVFEVLASHRFGRATSNEQGFLTSYTSDDSTHPEQQAVEKTTNSDRRDIVQRVRNKDRTQGRVGELLEIAECIA